MDLPQAPTATPASIVPSIESQQFNFQMTPSPAPRITLSPAPRKKSWTAGSQSKPTTNTNADFILNIKGSRVRLSQAEQLVLMNLVCEHLHEYKDGKIKFWKLISELLEEDTGLLF